jgi:hypothetical protein
MTYWIEDDENKEFGFETLTTAKRRSRVLMRRRIKEGDSYPLVHIIADDNSAAWHFDNFSQRWFQET